MRRPFLTLLVALPLAVACGGSSSDEDAPAPPPSRALAAGVTISQIDLFQGVQVPLMKDGEETGHLAPVIQGRDGTARVHFALSDDFAPRDVVVQVTITGDDGAPQLFETTYTLESASSEPDLESTANVAIPGSAIGPGARWSIAILEPTPGATIAGDTSGARWPATDTQALSPEFTQEKTRIVLVPVVYLADGSGRQPDTDDAYVEALRQRMFALYPTPAVEITVGAGLNFNTKISGTQGGGWQSLVEALISRRNKDKAERDVYYYGVVNPAASINQFCGGGCIAGLTLGPAKGPQPAELRVSVGLGFGGELTAGTFVHETGHAHGLAHAPCGGAQGVDGKYPYKGGQTGVYGLDAKGLRAPNVYKDMMSYCEPTWISDYNYANLAVEMQRVAGARVLGAALPAYWRLAFDDGDGELRLGERIPATDLPTGREVSLEVRDAAGAVRVVTGYAYDWDHGAGALVTVPDDGTITSVKKQ